MSCSRLIDSSVDLSIYLSSKTSFLNFQRGNTNSKITRWPIALIICELLVVFVLFCIKVGGVSVGLNYNCISMAGYSKALITLVKYMPQVYLNWKRKSTVGWSLENVILDLTGGSFSLVQLVIDVFPRHNPAAFNPTKFALAVIAIFFDLLFLFQHYVLYRAAWIKDRRQRRLKGVEESIKGMEPLSESREDSDH